MRFLFFALFSFFYVSAVLHADTLPSQVVVLANRDNAESLLLARHYMKARAIPEQNLISLPLNMREEISWAEFTTTLWDPLIAILQQKGWLTGEMLPGVDTSGRRRIKISENKIGYLVLCRGVPLRIADSPAIVAVEKKQPGARFHPDFSSCIASVDSELATLPMAGIPATGFVPNPIFQKLKITAEARQSIVHVSRLDGPSLADCLRLVDGVQYAEQYGLTGRAYVDQGGPHKQGDDWLKDTTKLLETTGYDLSVEETSRLIEYDKRADAPALYFGWYSQNIAGRFADPDVSFVPGSIALHIHSFSAITLRSPTRGWAGPLVAKGASVTFGNVSEPYLQFTTVPSLFLAVLLKGWQVGDAYAMATAGWSWQSILIGDPLYRPFKISLLTQLEHIRRRKPGGKRALRDYVLLRYANLLRLDHKEDLARNILAAAVRERPTLALRYALALQADHPAMAWQSGNVDVGTEDTGLLVEVARYLQKNALPGDSLAAYKALLGRRELPRASRVKILNEAAAVAAAIGDDALAAKWLEDAAK
ncbi:MAG: TIGR03790 family protein [Puniceicoccales bacterium]|jgi:uncharacterized protein (TIGR03790 family)|nr:TIGR03790 family protein [Puniceicoccales bacterium]